MVLLLMYRVAVGVSELLLLLLLGNLLLLLLLHLLEVGGVAGVVHHLLARLEPVHRLSGPHGQLPLCVYR
jgi:hypothetical protein